MRILRVGIPVGDRVGAVGVVLDELAQSAAHLSTKLPIASAASGGLRHQDHHEAAQLAGFTSDQRAYEVTARAAAQDLTKPDVVELQDIRATVEMQDKARDGD